MTRPRSSPCSSRPNSRIQTGLPGRRRDRAAVRWLHEARAAHRRPRLPLSAEPHHRHAAGARMRRLCDRRPRARPPVLGRWHDPAISPYPFFAVPRLAGRAPTRVAPEHLPALAAQLGAALPRATPRAGPGPAAPLGQSVAGTASGAPDGAGLLLPAPCPRRRGAPGRPGGIVHWDGGCVRRARVGGAQGGGGAGARAGPRRPPRGSAPRRRVRHADRDPRLGVRRRLVSPRRLHRGA